MKKIYKLKKWLTLEEAAKRLTIELGEEIATTDILQLSIDKQIKISVNFPHNWKGKICDITTDHEKASKYEEIIGIEGEPVRLYEYERCGDEYIKIKSEIYSFEPGIYEVKLIGQGKLDLEHKLKLELNLPNPGVYNLSGFYVQTNGIVIERQSELKYKNIPVLSKKLIKTEFIKVLPKLNNLLKEHGSDKNITTDDIQKIIDELEDREDCPTKTMYYPCATIDEIEGAFFVIQTEHLNEFIANLDDDNQNNLTLSHSLYLLGEILNVVKSKTKKWTQGEIIREILEQRQNQNKTNQRLEQRKIEEYFSKANKQFKAE